MTDEQIDALWRYCEGLHRQFARAIEARTNLASGQSAEPIYQSKTTPGWIDVSEEHYDLVLEQCRRIVYATPPQAFADAWASANALQAKRFHMAVTLGFLDFELVEQIDAAIAAERASNEGTAK